MRETIAGVLQGDATLAGTLTGGVYAGTEISRQLTPGAFDGSGEIKPCALVRVENDVQHGPYTGGTTLSARTYVVVYAYQRAGYDSIDAALARARALLHRQRPATATATWSIDWAGDSADLRDEGLDCAMRFGRYVVTRRV
jgi:hypothetical protein